MARSFGASGRDAMRVETFVTEKGEQNFEFESLQDRERVLHYLESLVQGVKEGTIRLGYGDQSLELSPGGLIELQLRAKRRSGRAKLSLRLSWREDENKAPVLEIGAT